MDKERNCQNIVTDDFLEKFMSERLEVGSENYRAVREALQIGRLYFERYKSTSGFLSGLEEKDIGRQKAEIMKINDDNSVFTDKFEEICDWMIADLGMLPTSRIYNKLRFLVDKIREADKGADLV